MPRALVVVGLCLAGVSGWAAADTAAPEKACLPESRQSEDDAAALLHLSVPLRRAKASAGEPRRVVEWNFTQGSEEAIRRWTEWDLEFGWSAPSRPDIDPSNRTAWPDLATAGGGWHLDLEQPQVFVLSMPKRVIRRQRFSREVQALGGLGSSIEWAPALDGKKIPVDLRWMNGFEDTEAWDYPRPGNWACFASHLAILRTAHARCPTCDVVVFEDDIVFAEGFDKRWSSFMSALPADWAILRMGGACQWNPPFEATEHYLRSRAVSNTWGYVVRANKVDRLADLLANLPVRGHWGIDAIFQLFAEELPTYSPPFPLVLAASECHDTETVAQGVDCETKESLERKAQEVVAHWPQGWFRTFCEARGVPRLGENPGADVVGCKNDATLRCCPYDGDGVPSGRLPEV